MDRVIGYTTGVFDMFHVGHLHLLKKASNHCDHLIVGVSTDKLVEDYKGRRPIIPFAHRFEIINSLKCVDQVVVQAARDKIEQYHEIGFNKMFVGSDWKGSDLFVSVERELKKFGVAVHYFEYTKNVSSTKFTEILEGLSRDGEAFQC